MRELVLRLLGGERRRAAILQSFWSNGAQFVEALKGFIVIPLAIHYSGVSGFGWWVTIMGIIQVFAMLDLGLVGPLQRGMAHAHARGDGDEFSRVFVAGVSIVALVAAIIFVLGLALTLSVRFLFGMDAASVEGIHLGLLFATTGAAIAIVNTLIRATGVSRLHPTSVLIPMLVFRVVGLGTTVILFIQGAGVAAIGAGQALTEVGILVYYVILVRRWRVISAIPSRRDYSKWFRIARLTFFARVAGGASERLEPTLIGLFVSVELASLYTLSKKAGAFLDRLLHSFWASIMAPLTNFSAQNGADARQQKYAWAYGALARTGITMYVLYVIISPWFISVWVGDEFIAGYELYVLIALALLSTLVYDVLNETFVLMDEPRAAAKQTIVVSALRLGGMYLLGTQFGILGMVSGVIVANLSMSVFIGARVHLRFHHFRSPPDMIATGVLFATLFVLTGVHIAGASPDPSVAPGFGSVVAWSVAALVCTGVVEWFLRYRRGRS